MFPDRFAGTFNGGFIFAVAHGFHAVVLEQSRQELEKEHEKAESYRKETERIRLEIAKEKMEKSVQSLQTELSTVRTGTANAAILDRVEVMYYGYLTPLNQMASISVPEPRMLMVKPFDKSSIKDIEKAIVESNLGLNPVNDGSVIRLPIPPLTEERRKELSKQISKLGEDAKVAIRNIRRDANDKVKADKKNSVMTEY